MRSVRIKAIATILFIGAIVTTPLISTALQPAQAGELLRPSELRRLFPGTFKAMVKGYAIRITAAANGRLHGQFGPVTDSGRWSLKGRRLCIRFNEWLDGRRHCSIVRRVSGKWYAVAGIRFRRL
ncbi:hypothetical protein [Thermopetrobacter sp. TC1]|uniref:hypothetical protein n=1 Tax=Thermopetrobacter sp. TC1 TaxID=1495045 RepID=UPI0012E031D9|nr:hypothetical protein [Thermopetrobacter sp. TC1]